jgi:hypothetical protein
VKDFARFALALLLTACAAARAQEQPAPNPYPTMAPVAQYLIADRAYEIALARSAAPPSISDHAEVLVLGRHQYQVAVKGNNGFVCLVTHSWFAGFDDPDFWNPKSRGPECMSPPAVRSVLPEFLARTAWVLAGDTKQQLIDKTKAAFASHRFGQPAAASFAFMLSKQGYLNNVHTAWLPHVMPFVPYGQEAEWGAGLPGSPILDTVGSPYEPTTLYIPVRRWSDGSPAQTPAPMDHHAM